MTVWKPRSRSACSSGSLPSLMRSFGASLISQAVIQRSPVYLNQCYCRDKFSVSRCPRVICTRRRAARQTGAPTNLEKGVMKLSGILGGAVVLLPLTLVAQALGVGDAQRGAQVFAQCKVCHSLEPGKNLLGPSLHGLIVRKAVS